MRRKAKNEAGYTLLVVILTSAVLLMSLMTLIVTTSYSVHSSKGDQQANTSQYQTDNLARLAYMNAVKDVHDVAVGTWPATGPSMQVALNIPDETQLIQTQILMNDAGDTSVTIGSNIQTGHYSVRPMPKAPSTDLVTGHRTYYLQAVGTLGTQTSVINFVVQFSSVDSAPQTVETYPYSQYKNSTVFDRLATSQSQIDTDEAQYRGTTGMVLRLADSGTPNSLQNLTLNGGDLIYGGSSSSFQALVSGDVMTNSGSSLTVHADLVAGNVSLNSNSSMVVDGNLVAKTLTVNANTSLTIKGQLQCDTIQLNSNAILNVGGSVVDKSGLMVDSNAQFTPQGSLSIGGDLTLNSNAQLTVGGLLTVQGQLTINSQAYLIANSSVQVSKSITMNSDGHLSVTNDLCGGGDFTENANAVAKISNQVTIAGKITQNSHPEFQYGSLQQGGTCALQQQLILTGLYQL